MSFRHYAKVMSVAVGLTLAVVFTGPAGAQLVSLKTIPVPEPLDLASFVVNRTAAIQLGKALFWDMQVGSDGVMSCATCHFQAGADSRTRNQINPGILGGDLVFNNNNLALPAPPAGQFGPNVAMNTTKFPFHKLTNKDQIGEPKMNPGNVISDCNDVMSSMGVELKQFVDIRPGNPVDLGTTIPDPPFQLAGVNIRRVEPRNTPPTINSVFNFTNFWDGRANNIFNGNNPFGPADSRPHLIFNGTTGLTRRLVRLRQSSLASQAVGPPLSDFEMSWRGRTWPKIGKKMLSLKPLAQQQVSPTDSVLGTLADTVAGTGLKTTYAALIKLAFPAGYWNNTTQIVVYNTNGNPVFLAKPATPLTTRQFTQMEANFSFFFGVAVQLYEATLVADDSRVDKFLEGSAALTFQESQGMNTFLGAGGCGACHAGGELTDASVFLLQGANPISGFPQPLNQNPLGAIEFMNVFGGGNGFYDLPFHNTGVRPGGSTDPAAFDFVPTNEDIGRGGDTGLPAPIANFPLSFSTLAMRKAGFGAPLPSFLSAYVPALPFGFLPIDTFPFPARVINNGACKTPHLRNIELTGPFMHNGGMATLRQVVDFYTRGGDFMATNANNFDPGVFPIGKLKGSSTRKNELVAFMLAMTDARVKNEAAPFDHPELFIPNDGRAPLSTGSRAGFLANTQFTRLPAVGSGGRLSEGLSLLTPFLNANQFVP